MLSVLWIDMHHSSGKDLLGSPALGVLHTRGVIDILVSNPHSTGPQVRSDTLRPSMRCMNKRCACKVLKLACAAFCNPILVMCIHSCKSQSLTLCSALLHPRICSKNAVVSVMSFDDYTPCFGTFLKSLLGNKRFIG